MVTDTSYQKCVYRKDGPNGTSPWLLHVNGHRYSERELNASGSLVYNETMVKACPLHTGLGKKSGPEVA